MIGNCPAHWFDENDKISSRYNSNLCERIPPSVGYSFVLDLPVLSLDTNRTYANIYCARCHSDASHLASWNASIECNKDMHTYENHQTIAVV